MVLFFSSLTSLLVSADCSYTCHLECERNVQLDCNQRDKELGQTPSPRSHCCSTAQQKKVNDFKPRIKTSRQNWVYSLTNKSINLTNFCKYGHSAACRIRAACCSLGRFWEHHLSKFKRLRNLPMSCWCVNVFLLMRVFALWGSECSRI